MEGTNFAKISSTAVGRSLTCEWEASESAVQVLEGHSGAVTGIAAIAMEDAYTPFYLMER